MPWDDEHALRQVALAEELLSGLDALPDNAAAARAAETVEALVGLYGECLARIADRLAEGSASTPELTPGSGSGCGDALRALADDPLVGHLLLVHDLHPDPVEVRVRDALGALDGEAELLELTATGARVRIRGGCGSGATEQAVREVLAARAPELEDAHVAVETAPPAAEETLIPVDALFRSPAPVPSGAASCTTAGAPGRTGAPTATRTPVGTAAGQEAG